MTDTWILGGLPPLARARAQEWFETCARVAMLKGSTPALQDGRIHSANLWTYSDDKVGIEYWAPYEMLKVWLNSGRDKHLILISVNNRKISTWAPEEDILNHLKSLIVLDLLAGEGES